MIYQYSNINLLAAWSEGGGHMWPPGLQLPMYAPDLFFLTTQAMLGWSRMSVIIMSLSVIGLTPTLAQLLKSLYLGPGNPVAWPHDTHIQIRHGNTDQFKSVHANRMCQCKIKTIETVQYNLHVFCSLISKFNTYYYFLSHLILSSVYTFSFYFLFSFKEVI